LAWWLVALRWLVGLWLLAMDPRWLDLLDLRLRTTGNIFPGAIVAGTLTTLSITGGLVTGTGVATHWAITDASNLLAVDALTASTAVSPRGVFSMAGIDITLASQ
jgi:hypothetical protein